jgi:hypothetical protein
MGDLFERSRHQCPQRTDRWEERLVDIIAGIESEAGISALAGGVAGAVLTLLGTAVVEAIKAKREGREIARKGLADYVTEIGDHLNGMIESFRKHQIPHYDGRAFTGLYSQFGELLYGYLSKDTQKIASELVSLAYGANVIDGGIYSIRGPKIPPHVLEAMNTWIIQAERVRGDLRTVAQKIRAERR